MEIFLFCSESWRLLALKPECLVKFERYTLRNRLVCIKILELRFIADMKYKKHCPYPVFPPKIDSLIQNYKIQHFSRCYRQSSWFLDFMVSLDKRLTSQRYYFK